MILIFFLYWFHEEVLLKIYTTVPRTFKHVWVDYRAEGVLDSFTEDFWLILEFIYLWAP